ncbi:MAG: hypothetical protein Q9191_000037 [Dirinaria sp. TL-2023a]
MAGPNGALAGTFKTVRAFQFISLIAIIGMAANFISDMVSNNSAPTDVLVGTLSIVGIGEALTKGSAELTTRMQTCIAVIYCVITYILFLDNILPYLISTAIDGLLLVALIVIAVVVGKPLSYLNCRIIGSASVAESAYQLSAELKASIHDHGGKVVYSNWIGASRSTCYEMKAIWGLSIALCKTLAPKNLEG